jgi:hypothetical protein
MGTLAQDIYNIRNIANHAKPATTSVPAESLIAYWIRYHRSVAINQTFMRDRHRVDTLLYQKSGCLTLTMIDQAECPCEEIVWGCPIWRVEIPKPLDLMGLPLLSVSLVDGMTPVELLRAETITYARHQQFTGNEPKAYLDGSVNEGMAWLYVLTDDKDFKYIKVREVCDDPTKMVTMVGTPGNCVPRYFDIDTDEYPMSGYIRAMVMKLIMEKELMMTMNSFEDILNNNREDRQLFEIKRILSQMELYEKRNDPGNPRTGQGRT